MQFCRICFDKDVRMMILGESEEKEFLKSLFTSKGVNKQLDSCYFLCYQCKALLSKSHNFFKKALEAQQAFLFLQDQKLVKTDTWNDLKNKFGKNSKLSYHKVELNKFFDGNKVPKGKWKHTNTRGGEIHVPINTVLEEEEQRKRKNLTEINQDNIAPNKRKCAISDIEDEPLSERKATSKKQFEPESSDIEDKPLSEMRDKMKTESRGNARCMLVKCKEQQRPLQKGQPNQSHKGHKNIETAKMLVFLQNGDERLITFTLPKECCTLGEVLQQINIPFSEDTHIQCMQNETNSEIVDYFVSVGCSTRIEELLENHPLLNGDKSSRSSSVLSEPQSSDESTPGKSSPLSQPQSSDESTPGKSSVLSQPQSSDDDESTPEKPSFLSQSQSSEMSTPEKPQSSKNVSPPAKFVEGYLALCKFCGYTGLDFSRCQRCKRVFTEEPKNIPMVQNKKEPAETPEKQECGEEIELNLLKNTTTRIYNKTKHLLARHEATHEEKKLSCNKCDKKFHYKYGLIQHQRKTHTGENNGQKVAKRESDSPMKGSVVAAAKK